MTLKPGLYLWTDGVWRPWFVTSVTTSYPVSLTGWCITEFVRAFERSET